jgi:hypothetical protein
VRVCPVAPEGLVTRRGLSTTRVAVEVISARGHRGATAIRLRRVIVLLLTHLTDIYLTLAPVSFMKLRDCGIKGGHLTDIEGVLFGH